MIVLNFFQVSDYNFIIFIVMFYLIFKHTLLWCHNLAHAYDILFIHLPEAAA